MESIRPTLGNTPAGRDWCIKALHPSDPANQVAGVPDQSAAFSVMANYQQTNNIGSLSGFQGPWSCQIYVFNDPTVHACFYAADSAGAVAAGCIVNQQWGNTVSAATDAFIAQNEAWRGVYYGCTVQLDCTSLTNQGTVAACQSIAKPIDLGHVNYAGSTPTTYPRVVRFQDADTPEYVQALQMPDCYIGKAVDGVYLPLRLDENHQRWHTISEDYSMDATSTNWTISGRQIVPALATMGVSGLYPNLANAYFTTVWNGDVHLLPCSKFVGTIAFENLHEDAALRLIFRSGYELMVQPGTIQTPFQKPSIEHDPEATDAYFAIRRKMKDAFPASYNDEGKLWSVIKSVAGALSPLVGAIPYIGPGLVMAGKAFGKAVDAKRARASMMAAGRAALMRSMPKRKVTYGTKVVKMPSPEAAMPRIPKGAVLLADAPAFIPRRLRVQRQ